jgi:hypothetical protein
VSRKRRNKRKSWGRTRRSSCLNSKFFFLFGFLPLKYIFLLFYFNGCWYLVILATFPTKSCTKICVQNCKIMFISLNIYRMWYCCKFILILQESGEIEEEYGIQKYIHGPCTISHGPHNLNSTAYTTTDATV